MALTDRVAAARGYVANTMRGPRRPYRLVLEITNACNLECTFCARTTEMRRPVVHMKPETFENLIRDNIPGLETVGLNGLGEPFCHPHLFRMIRFARDHGVGVAISTNCTLLDEKRARALLETGIEHVTLAIDGITPETYESVRVGAKFQPVVENARRFIALKHEMRAKTYVVVQCIAMTETREHLRDVRNFWADAGPDAIRIRQLTHTGNKREDAVYLNGQGRCYWLWAEPMILSNGTVVPCCQDVDGKLPLGNIHETPLRDILAGPRAVNLRRMHVEGRRQDIPLCKGCNMYQPSPVLAAGASLFDTNTVNRWVPFIESQISRWRY